MRENEEESLEDEMDSISRCINELSTWLLPPFSEQMSDSVPDTIKNATGAEAVSVFQVSRKDPKWLEFAAGVGYNKTYRSQKYPIDGPFLTSAVFQTQKPINYHAKELRERQNSRETLPFSGRCQLFIGSGKFLNIIAVPLVFSKKVLWCSQAGKQDGKSGDTVSRSGS